MIAAIVKGFEQIPQPQPCTANGADDIDAYAALLFNRRKWLCHRSDGEVFVIADAEHERRVAEIEALEVAAVPADEGWGRGKHNC